MISILSDHRLYWLYSSFWCVLCYTPLCVLLSLCSVLICIANITVSVRSWNILFRRKYLSFLLGVVIIFSHLWVFVECIRYWFGLCLTHCINRYRKTLCRSFLCLWSAKNWLDKYSISKLSIRHVEYKLLQCTFVTKANSVFAAIYTTSVLCSVF